jgi:hypothetical protein
VLFIQGRFVAGIPHPLEPYRLMKMMVVIAFTAFALTNLMFLLLARVDDPMPPVSHRCC